MGWFPMAPCAPLGPSASLQKLRSGESVTTESGWDPGQRAAVPAKYKPVCMERVPSPA